MPEMLASTNREYYIHYWLSQPCRRRGSDKPDKGYVKSLTRPDFFCGAPLTSREFVKVFTSELSYGYVACSRSVGYSAHRWVGAQRDGYRKAHRERSTNQGVLPPWTGATVLPAAMRTRSCSSRSGRPVRPCCKSSRPRRSAGGEEVRGDRDPLGTALVQRPYGCSGAWAGSGGIAGEARYAHGGAERVGDEIHGAQRGDVAGPGGGQHDAVDGTIEDLVEAALQCPYQQIEGDRVGACAGHRAEHRRQADGQAPARRLTDLRRHVDPAVVGGGEQQRYHRCGTLPPVGLAGQGGHQTGRLEVEERGLHAGIGAGRTDRSGQCPGRSRGPRIPTSVCHQHQWVRRHGCRTPSCRTSASDRRAGPRPGRYAGCTASSRRSEEHTS